MRFARLAAILGALVFWFFGALAAADEGVRGVRGVRFEGVIKQKGTRDPLPDIEITLTQENGETLQQNTDENGHFHFDDLSPGTITFHYRGPTIIAGQFKETLRGAKVATIYAQKKSTSFATVVRSRTTHRELIETTLSADEVKSIAGNQNDVVKAVQNLPGVARAPFGVGQLVVWGSSPSDTRAYADGVLIPRVYHFGGLRSTISAEFVSDLRFTPGAYGANYGRGLGGVVEITTRAPRSDRIHGSVTLDLIDGGVTLEGPITKKLHFAVGARISWISVFLPIFNKSATQLSPFYWDYQVALHYQATSRDDLDLLIFGATSDVTAKVDSTDPNSRVDIDSKSYFGRARLRYTHRFSQNSMLWLMPSIGGDTFLVDTKDNGFGGTPVRLKVRQLGYNLRGEFRQKLYDWLSYSAGLDFEGTYAQVETLQPVAPLGGYGSAVPVGGGDTVLSAGRSESSFIGTGFFADSDGPPVLELLSYHLASTAPYLMANLTLGDRLALQPQLRVSIDSIYLDSDAHGNAPSYTRLFWEPRLSARMTFLPDKLWLVAGLGIYHQAPQGAELSPRFGNPYLLWQTGTTYTLGFEASIVYGLRVEAQGFYKDLRNLVVPDAQTNYDNEGLGRVYGGELLIRQPLWHGLTGWIAYTLSRSERRNQVSEPWRLYQFDQTHILTLIASYKLPWGLTTGLRFRYVTGNPTTPYLGGVRDLSYQSYYAIIGDLNSVRMPDFHQLDVRIDKTFTFNRWRLGMYLEVQNVYNRKNPENLIYGGRQLYQQGRVTGLPIFPNLGFRADF